MLNSCSSFVPSGSFTGGDTGISISKKAGMIPLQMELGGKDACIVLEDADIDLVAANIIKGGFSYRYSTTGVNPACVQYCTVEVVCYLQELHHVQYCMLRTCAV